ncbi:hypothetical protein JOM56_002855 [Amanita muscaria]
MKVLRKDQAAAERKKNSVEWKYERKVEEIQRLEAIEIERLQPKISSDVDAKQPKTKQVMDPTKSPDQKPIDSGQPLQAHGELTYDDYVPRMSGSSSDIWTSTVQLDGKAYDQGQGRPKAETRELAAANALAALQHDPPYIKNRQWLYNYVGSYHLGELTYEDRDQPGPNVTHNWTSIVQLNGVTFGQGQGSTKGQAMERAAAAAVAAMQDL